MCIELKYNKKIYCDKYPDKFKVEPLSEEVKQIVNNKIIPDKAQNVINRQRKDHT